MRDKEKIKNKLAQIFDLPQEVLLNLPSISLIGNLNLVIENHRGIIKYTPQLIKVRVYHGKIVILGEELMIESLEEDIVVVEGRITDLSFKLGLG